MSSTPPYALLRAEIKHLKEINAELLTALEALVERIDTNGGIGEYKGGPAFVMKGARAAIAKAKAP